MTDILQKGVIGSDGSVIATLPSLGELDTSKVLQALRRLTLIKPVEFMIRLGEGEMAGGVSLHFEAVGWKLSGLQLPTPAVRALARNLISNRKAD